MILDTDEKMILPSQVIDVVYGVPDLWDFINDRSGIFFKRSSVLSSVGTSPPIIDLDGRLRGSVQEGELGVRWTYQHKWNIWSYSSVSTKRVKRYTENRLQTGILREKRKFCGGTVLLNSYFSIFGCFGFSSFLLLPTLYSILEVLNLLSVCTSLNQKEINRWRTFSPRVPPLSSPWFLQFVDTSVPIYPYPILVFLSQTF